MFKKIMQGNAVTQEVSHKGMLLPQTFLPLLKCSYQTFPFKFFSMPKNTFLFRQTEQLHSTVRLLTSIQKVTRSILGKGTAYPD
jgi:hypothetical protein